jgi:hypothetical protein
MRGEELCRCHPNKIRIDFLISSSRPPIIPHAMPPRAIAAREHPHGFGPKGEKIVLPPPASAPASLRAPSLPPPHPAAKDLFGTRFGPIWDANGTWFGSGKDAVSCHWLALQPPSPPLQPLAPPSLAPPSPASAPKPAFSIPFIRIFSCPFVPFVAALSLRLIPASPQTNPTKPSRTHQKTPLALSKPPFPPPSPPRAITERSQASSRIHRCASVPHRWQNSLPFVRPNKKGDPRGSPFHQKSNPKNPKC